MQLSDEMKKCVLEDPEFQCWRQDLLRVALDGECFTVIHGDRLATDDEVILEWVHLFRPDWSGVGEDGV